MSLSSAAAAALGTVHEHDFEDAASHASSSRASSKAPSVTDWEGEDAAPEFVTIGKEHCRCIFKFKTIPYTLVCGNTAETCRRDKHDGGEFNKAPSGVYKAHLFRKHLNGIYSTYMSEEEFQEKDERERHQLRNLAFDLDSVKFDSAPPESEWTFSKRDESVDNRNQEADEPYDQKVSSSTKPAVLSQKPSVLPKMSPSMPMKPRVPDMSLPFPKKVTASAPTPSTSLSGLGHVSAKLDQFSDAMEFVVKNLVKRMDDIDARSDAFQQHMAQNQTDTKTTLSALEKAMTALAQAQAAQMSQPNPSSASASAPSTTSAPTAAPTPSFRFGSSTSTSVRAPSAASSQASTSATASSMFAPAPVPAPAPAPASIPAFNMSHGSVPISSTMHPSGGSGGSSLGGSGVRNQLPPVSLLGTDKSKEKDEVFGVQLRSEAQLKQDLSPPGIFAETRDDLAANMVDSVSLPGTFSGSEETSALDGTHQVAEAVRELLAQNRGGQSSERVRVDHGWRSTKRISLHAIKGAEQLRTQYCNLTDISEEVLSHFIQSTLAILQAGRLTDYVAEQWSQNGFYWRLVRDSLTWYTDLHLHLLNINLNHGWERVQVELKYHCNKLWMIRTSASNRLVCLCKTYCYLRNGKRNHWINDDLLSKRLDQMSLLFTKQPKRNQGAQGDKLDAGANLCRKCRTNCHAPDVACPWKNMKDADARKAAAAWMLNPVAPS